MLTFSVGNGTPKDNLSLEKWLGGLSPAAEVVSALHQDTHAVHSHEAYHQQAEGTHLQTGVVGKRGRDKQTELELYLQMIKTLLGNLPMTELPAELSRDKRAHRGELSRTGII